jgi:hypothetical protein
MLKSEEEEFVKIHSTKHVQLRFNKFFASNSDLKYYFSAFNVDEYFNRSLIPSAMVKRVLTSIRKIKFNQKLVDAANNISDSLIHPSLGVSIRSWSANHEGINNISHLTYSQESYEEIISHIVLHNTGLLRVESVLVAFDNPDLIYFYKPFLDALPATVIYFNHGVDITPIEKGFIELLALSKTTFLIGDSRSTFIRAVYWMGECRQRVFHPKNTSISGYIGSSSASHN